MRKIALLGASSAMVTAFAAGDAPAAPKPATAARGRTGPKPGSERVAPVISEIDSDVPLPAQKSRGNSSYPFDSLAAPGQSFHVANKTAKQLSSIVSAANRKRAVEKRDVNGAIVMKTVKIKDADGKTIGTQPGDKPEMVNTVVFEAVDVGADDKRGKGARVFRRA